MASQGNVQRAPLARTEDLRVQELGSEIVIYDLRTDEAHCLGPVAARVWRACDGERPLADLGESAEITAALVEIADKGLLVERVPGGGSGMSRRQLVGRMAVAAAAAPLIVSVSAPPAHAAVSCIALNQPCTVGSAALPCCPGTSCKNAGHGSKTCQT